jgi:methyl-accepting chemotaxis protein
MFGMKRRGEVGHEQALLRAVDSSLAIIEFAVDSTILTANKNFLKAAGYDLADIQGKKHSIFVDPKERESSAYKKFWEKLRGGQFQSGEYRRVGKSGNAIWLEATYNPVFDGYGKLDKVVKLATDITEKKTNSARNVGKLESLDKSQAIIEFLLDGTIETANENFLRVMGYSLAEVRGQHHSLFVTKSLKDSDAYKKFWAALREGQFQAGEYSRITKDGREVWLQASYNPILDAAGKPFRVIKFATDITRKKLAQVSSDGWIEAIKKSQAVIEFNLDGTIVDANANFLGTLGYTLPEIVGKHHSLFLDAAAREKPEYRQFWDQLRKGQFQSGLYRRLGKGGREVWIEASYNPILDAHGQPIKVVKFAADVTKRIVEAQKNKRVSDMLQSVAAGAEELTVSVREISQSMAQSSKAAGAAFELTVKADAASKRLFSAAQDMGGIVEMINTITGQINLLALNATIEAARAGEAGKGFAVVASEVKNLANQAKSATDRVSAEIDNIRGISSEVDGALDTIQSAIGSVREYVTTTAAAVEQQSAVTSDMSASMQRAAAAAREGA